MRPICESIEASRPNLLKPILILGRIWAGKSIFHRENRRPFTVVTRIRIAQLLLDYRVVDSAVVRSKTVISE